jgi:hypothetical protein
MLATEKKCGQEVTESRHIEIARDKPGEEKIPLVADYLSTEQPYLSSNAPVTWERLWSVLFQWYQVEVYSIAKSKPSEGKC